MQLKYNTSSLVAVIALVSLAALAPSCSSSDDSSTATGGTGGSSTGGQGGSAGHAGTSTGGTGGSTAGTGGATAGTGGATGGTGGSTAGTGGATGGTGGATAGTGGTGGAHQGGMAGDIGEGGEAGAPASIPCGGCAVVTAPFGTLVPPLPATIPGTDELTAQIFFNSVNLTGVSITMRACVVSGDANSAVQMYLQNGAPNYGGDYGVLYKAFPSVSNCSVGMQDLTIASVADVGTSFLANAVTSLTVQLLPNNATGPFVNSTLYIDSITSSGDAIGPWNFTSNASALGLQSGIAGGSISWIP